MNINYDNPFNFKPIPTITPASSYWQNGTWKFNMSEITAGGASQPSWIDVILKGNTALTLVNAKANGLNYLKLFGGTEQRNLPVGFTQVEYLESSGTQYIDTGYKPNQNTYLKTSYVVSTNQSGANTAVLGCTKDPSPSIANYGMLRLIYPNRVGFGGNTGGSVVDISVGNTPSVLYELEYNKNVVTIKQGEQTLNVTTLPTGSSWAAPYNLYLFARNTAGSATFNISAKIYSTYITDGTTTLNLIPCRRNSDSVLGMYDTVTNTFLTNSGTGTFTAGADVVPSPDTPMDIVSNNGVLKVNTNLYWTEYNGQQLSQVDGVTLSANASVNVSGMVDCRTIKSFMITTANPAGSYRLFKYNSSKSFIDANTTGNIGDVVTLDSTVGYFRMQYNFSSGNVGTENILIYNSAYSLNGIYTDGTTETVEVTGKNLFDKDDVAYNDSTILADGSIISAENISVLDYIPVQPNTAYTYSSTTNSARAYNKRIVCFDANKNYITSIADTTGNPSGPFSITGTTPANTRYVRVACSNDQMATAQLEQGSTATTYEPYFNGGTATAEMLLKVGTYQDVQSVIDGGVSRSIGVKVLKGADDEFYVKNGNRYYYAPPNVLNEGNIRSTNLLCSHFLNSTTGVEGDCFKYSVQIYFYPNMTLCPDATAFKQWVVDQYNSGNPVVIVYPLQTPTTETVTGQPLTTQAGTNIVEITQASMDNLELEVKYKAGVAVTITEVENAQLDNNVEVTIQ